MVTPRETTGSGPAEAAPVADAGTTAAARQATAAPRPVTAAEQAPRAASRPTGFRKVGVFTVELERVILRGLTAHSSLCSDEGQRKLAPRGYLR